MKHIIPFKLYESDGGPKMPTETSPEDFFRAIGFRPAEVARILEWWNTNRGDLKIKYFPFKSNDPIMGCFFGENTVAVNKKPVAPPPIKLFITLHESKHCDQFREGRFEDEYFGTVKRGDREGFLKAYEELEREANDYGVESMIELGFGDFILPQEPRLRGNESQGKIVYQMMSRDIAASGAETMLELLIGQAV